MHKVRLRKVGGSTVLAIPPALLDLLDLSVQAEVALDIDAGRLIVTPERRHRYRLDDLIAQSDTRARRPKREALEAAPPKGRELI
jgi:antitoxin ChpS